MPVREIYSIKALFNLTSVNPVRELCSLTVCADGGIKPPSAVNGNDPRLKSVAFSNGVNIDFSLSASLYASHNSK